MATELNIDNNAKRAITKFKLNRLTKNTEITRETIKLTFTGLNYNVRESVKKANDYYNTYIVPGLSRFDIPKALKLLELTNTITKIHMSEGKYDILFEDEVFSLLIVLRRNFLSIIKPIENTIYKDDESLCKELAILMKNPDQHSVDEWNDYHQRLYVEIKKRINNNTYDNISVLYECFFKGKY